MIRLLAFILLIVSSSCADLNYYQYYHVDADDNFKDKQKLLYEDKNVVIDYDLWSNGGQLLFTIYNKTDKDIIINLRKSFFVINGIANEYFQDRTLINGYSSVSSSTYSSGNYSSYYRSANSRTSTTTTLREENSSQIKDKEYLTIPSKTAIQLNNFYLTNRRIINCNLRIDPSGSNFKKASFSKSDSPIIVRNIITLLTPNDSLRLENSFYVNELVNYRTKDFETIIDTSVCGRKLFIGEYMKGFKFQNDNSFYFKYNLKD